MIKSIDVHIRAAGYENIYFDCPKCAIENIFNRVTDMDAYRPVSRMNGLVCRNSKCQQTMNIVGDTVVTAKYLWFLNELYIFVARQEYRSYILSLCQGLEAFFYQSIINKKFDRNPQYRNASGFIILTSYNRDLEVYKNSIKSYTFDKMRKEFFDTFEAERNDSSLGRKELKEDKREEAFNILGQTQIHNLRNKVAHKFAYRPSLNETLTYDDLISAVYWLGAYLEVKDSTSYVNNKL
jgi:hypothetical protein